MFDLVTQTANSDRLRKSGIGGGGGVGAQPIILANFPQKLYVNEDLWTRGPVTIPTSIVKKYFIRCETSQHK